MNIPLFRKISLQRFSTPDQLDQLLQITSSRSWIALMFLCLFIFLVFLWSVFGTISTTVSGQAILLPINGIQQVYSQGSGLIKEILVHEGDYIVKGQMIAKIDQSDLKMKVTQDEQEIDIKIVELQSQLKSLKEKTHFHRSSLPEERESIQNKVLDVQSQLAHYQNQLVLENHDYQESSIVRSFQSGWVTDVLVSPYTLIQRGAPLMNYVLEKDQDIWAIAFVDQQGGVVESGMRAEISPSSIKREEYGSIRGSVGSASEFPISESTVYDLLRNRSLVQYFMKDKTPYLVHVKLDRDAQNPSGYHWSSHKAPPQKIRSGMLCDVRIVLYQQRPIELIFPMLKRWIGY